MVVSKRKRAIKHLLTYGILLIALLGTLFPLYWMIKSSLSVNSEMYMARPKLFPTQLTLEHYRNLFTSTVFTRNLLNSLYIAGITTIAGLAISILGSYAMTRLRFPLRGFFQKSILLSYLLPTAVMFIPMYVAVSSLGFNDNKNGLLIIYPTFVVPYCCYMLMSYFRAIPYSLEEAALIDGCTRLMSMLRIVIPIALPGIAVVATFAFTMSWNEFLYAMIMTTKATEQTATAAISSFKYADHTIWGLLMSASVVASLPVVILYVVAQSMLISGKADGGVK